MHINKYQKHQNMNSVFKIFFVIILLNLGVGCTSKIAQKETKTAAQILGDSKYLAISYGGYREKSREDNSPTILELKEDLKLMYAMNIRILRTYNVQPKLPHAANVLEAIQLYLQS